MTPVTPVAKVIEHRSIDTLIPNARNARTHSDAQVAEIAGSIRAFGFNSPVLITDDGGIIAGHGRVAAARKLGMTNVPCVVLDHLSERDQRAYVLADNKIALNAGWDDEMLAIELADLSGLDVDLAGLGFDDHELASILASGSVDELDAMPPLPDGDKEPFQQMTFTLHDQQAEQVTAAITAAKALGPFDSPNENSNGNALARICAAYLNGQADHAYR